MIEEVRTRIAPSPTGPLHIGTAHTALFNWLFAKGKGGKFILRIEDTDKERSKEEYISDITSGLAWLGLDWDEGPERNDGCGPYIQSQRLPVYQKYCQELIEAGKAYYCYCTKEELEKERNQQASAKQAPRYSGRCRNLSQTEIDSFKKEGRKPAIRFKVEEKLIKFKDIIKGELEFDSKLFGDFIILKSDGLPTFMFSGAIDDFKMKISHVIRGEDHISNTPRQILLAEALNFTIPEYGHLPLILNPDRSKLSKRKNPTSINQDFKKAGYLPEAIINFLALMGWSSETEKDIWKLDELITEFNLAHVGKSPAVFDQKKLDYLNGYYLRRLSLGELAKQTADFLGKCPMTDNKETFLTALSLVQERIKKLSDIPEQIEYFYQPPITYEKKPAFKKMIIPKGGTTKKTLLALEQALKYLEKETDFSCDSLEQLLRAVAAKNQLSGNEILWPVRVALTGKEASPGAFEILTALGKEESLRRLKAAIDVLK